jgi:hypothetical protein
MIVGSIDTAATRVLTLQMEKTVSRTGFPKRDPKNVVRSSGTNRAISIKVFNLRERFQISLKILREFSSGNWQYRSSAPALSTASSFFSGHVVFRIIFSSISSVLIDRGFTMEE